MAPAILRTGRSPQPVERASGKASGPGAPYPVHPWVRRSHLVGCHLLFGVAWVSLVGVYPASNPSPVPGGAPEGEKVNRRRHDRIRGFVADDHPIYREGIVRATAERPDLELVGQASNGREALGEIQRLEPDVALLDIMMPELTGLEVLGALERDEIATQVALLSAHVDS